VPPLVLAGGEDYAVQLWDVATGRELPGFMRRGWVDWIAFSPDGKLLAAARYAGLFPPFPAPWYEPRTLVHLWERQGGQPLKLSTSYHFEVGGLAFSPDSIRLAVANSKHISLIDVRERQEVYRFRCRAWSSRPSFSPDGKFIAAGDRHGTIYLWDVDTGKERPVNPSRTACPGTVVFSPVGDILAAGGDGTNTIHFWDASSGREVKSLSFPQGAPCPFFFTPDGRALVGGGAEATPVVHMWDAETGKELQRWDLTPFLEQGKR
jgi:WD40 repeat protein